MENTNHIGTRGEKSVSCVLILYYLVFLLLLITSTTSCVSEKKLAKLCSEKFPPRDSTVIRDRVITDTINVPGDTVRVVCPPILMKDSTSGVVIKVPVIKNVPCPPKQILYRTVVRDSIIFRENTALVSHQKNIIALRDKTIDDVREDLSFYKKWFWILLLIIAGAIAVRILSQKIRIGLP